MRRIALVLLAIVAVSAKKPLKGARAKFIGNHIEGGIYFWQDEPTKMDYFSAIGGLAAGNYIGLMGKPSSFDSTNDADLTKGRPPTIIFRHKWTDQSLSESMGSTTGVALTDGADNSIVGMKVAVYRDPGGSKPFSKLQEESATPVAWGILKPMYEDLSLIAAVMTDPANDPQVDVNERTEYEDWRSKL